MQLYALDQSGWARVHARILTLVRFRRPFPSPFRTATMRVALDHIDPSIRSPSPLFRPPHRRHRRLTSPSSSAGSTELSPTHVGRNGFEAVVSSSPIRCRTLVAAAIYEYVAEHARRDEADETTVQSCADSQGRPRLTNTRSISLARAQPPLSIGTSVPKSLLRASRRSAASSSGPVPEATCPARKIRTSW